jgi:hypothetical protein
MCAIPTSRATLPEAAGYSKQTARFGGLFFVEG